MSDRKGLNSTHLKHRNRGLLLQHIAGESLSRADLSKRMGLTKMAITKITGDLIEEGYITETETEETASVGRNPMLLDISPSAPIALGVYLSRNEVCVFLSDLKLHTLYTQRLPLQKETAESLTEKLFSLTDRAIEIAKENGARLLGIGVAAIGPLNAPAGTILRPTNFFGIENYPVAALLQERYGLPVLLENDMNAAALAENLYGTGLLLQNFLYLGITNGIGAGIVTDGQLYRSHGSAVGEIGHMSIRFDGPLCSCGNHGCLELYANMPVILRKLEQASGKAGLQPQDLDRLSNDPLCDGILLDMTDKLSVALVNAVNLLDCDGIVIGHEGAFLPPKYLQRAETYLNHRIFACGEKTVTVRPSAFRDRAPLVGSVCLWFHRLFSGEAFPDGIEENEE